MNIVKTVPDLRSFKSSVGDESLGFVPTMGALHKGHAELVKASVNENYKTLVSIFVNPKQFNEEADFLTYPKNTEEDLDFCKTHGVDTVFLPEPEEIFFKNESISLKDQGVSLGFEGEMRPGHFEGVLLILLKLLNLVGADKVYMGEKDYQQVLLTEKLCESFFISTEVRRVKTYRDHTGLPYSSRNKKLSTEGLKNAQIIASAFQKSCNKQEFLEILKTSAINEVDLDYYGELNGKVLMAHRLEGVRILDNKEISL